MYQMQVSVSATPLGWMTRTSALTERKEGNVCVHVSICDAHQMTQHFKCLNGPFLMLCSVVITELCSHSAHMGQASLTVKSLTFL